jgi:hypothetical protein
MTSPKIAMNRRKPDGGNVGLKPKAAELGRAASDPSMCKTLWLEPTPIVMTGIRNIHFYAGQHWR